MERCDVHVLKVDMNLQLVIIIFKCNKLLTAKMGTHNNLIH